MLEIERLKHSRCDRAQHRSAQAVQEEPEPQPALRARGRASAIGHSSGGSRVLALQLVSSVLMSSGSLVAVRRPSAVEQLHANRPRRYRFATAPMVGFGLSPGGFPPKPPLRAAARRAEASPAPEQAIV